MVPRLNFRFFLFFLISIFTLFILVNIYMAYESSKISILEGNQRSCDQTINSISLRNKRILVTGGAGFIGSDNFNSYYSRDLKAYRAISHLDKSLLYYGSVCNKTLIEWLLEKYNINVVVHLAAQAGVRYSLTNPLQYIKDNMECFVILLEAIASRIGNNIKLVYASSSSVYGHNVTIPFNPEMTGSPLNMYALTKRGNELLAASYYNLYGVSSLGLRFFTVYGPAGRPDMTIFSFSSKMLSGNRIFIYGNGGLKRDFTYIDDIVDGVIKSIKFISSHSGHYVFNLGKGHPDSVNEMVDLIYNSLSVYTKVDKNNIVYTSHIPKSEMEVTYADITHTYAATCYSPSVSLSDGIAKYNKWFFMYSNLNDVLSHYSALKLFRLQNYYDNFLLDKPMGISSNTTNLLYDRVNIVIMYKYSNIVMEENISSLSYLSKDNKIHLIFKRVVHYLYATLFSLSANDFFYYCIYDYLLDENLVHFLGKSSPNNILIVSNSFVNSDSFNGGTIMNIVNRRNNDLVIYDSFHFDERRCMYKLYTGTGEQLYYRYDLIYGNVNIILSILNSFIEYSNKLSFTNPPQPYDDMANNRINLMKNLYDSLNRTLYFSANEKIKGNIYEDDIDLQIRPYDCYQYGMNLVLTSYLFTNLINYVYIH